MAMNLSALSPMFTIESVRKILGLPAKRHVVALIGKAGTGKSYHSQRIATERGLELIVDDGLLIKNTGIIGGRSAKNEHTRIAATKVAIFLDEAQLASAQECIKTEKIRRILVVGTSLKMVTRISGRLGLGAIHKILRVEDLLTPEELRVAQSHRQTLGRHLIAVPAMEVRKRYPAIFYKSVQTAISSYIGKFTHSKTDFEGSVVRPKFGRHYKLSISEKAIRQIISTAIADTHRAITIRSMKIKWVRSEACRIHVLIDVGFMQNISGVVFDIEKRVKHTIEQNTGLIVEMVEVVVDSVASKGEES
jgi:uncharacterized alkaline shock family protein YloU